MPINTQTFSVTTTSGSFTVNLQTCRYIELLNVGPNNIHVNYTTNSAVIALADECQLIRPNERMKFLPFRAFNAIAEVGTSSLQVNAILF